MKTQPARRLNSYTPRAIGVLGAATVEAIAGQAHKRAINTRNDRGSDTAIFVARGGSVFAFDADSLTAAIWMRDRLEFLICVINPARPDYSKEWLTERLREEMASE